MSEIQLHAPYLYLNQVDPNQYNLFIMVPYQAGEQVNPTPSIEQTNGSTLISLTITGQANDPTSIPLRHPVRVPLDPVALTQEINASFDVSTFCIEVNCCKHENDNGTQIEQITMSRMYYADADQVNNSPNLPKAYNCPYLYLKVPNAESGEQGNGTVTYDPYCLVPLENSHYFASNVDNTNNGKYIQQILFSPDGGNGTPNYTEVDPNIIPSNLNTYNQIGFIDGYFDVEVSENSTSTTRPRRKGRIRNIDSDTNPNSFIDLSPF